MPEGLPILNPGSFPPAPATISASLFAMSSQAHIPLFQIVQLGARRLEKTKTAFRLEEAGHAHDFSVLLVDGREFRLSYVVWDSDRREVRADALGDHVLKLPGGWNPLCMQLDRVRFKDAFYDRARIEIITPPGRLNPYPGLRSEPLPDKEYGYDAFAQLAEVGMRLTVKANQLPDYSHTYSRTWCALFDEGDMIGPLHLFVLTRILPEVMDHARWPEEQLGLF
jgi:hypothetical protein